MTLKELEEQKKLLAEAATAQKQAIEDQTNTAIDDLKAEQESIIKDYDAEYNDIVNLANVQKHISQREVSEAMANAGMTDSGLNRTQQTAVQLSYANAENQARIARQKSVDTLAATVREKIHSLESSMKTNQANVDADYAENITKLQDAYDTQGNKKYEASNKLIPTLNDVDKTTTEKLSLLINYADQYGTDKALAPYAKTYYNEIVNDANATQKAKDAAAQVYAKVAGADAVDDFAANGNYGAINTLLNTLDGDELDALFAKLDENGIEIDFATNTVRKKEQKPNNQAEPVQESSGTIGVSSKHSNNGNANITYIAEDLANAFRKNGLKGYLELVNKYAEDYSAAAMDEYMLKTFGHFWLMATGTEEAKAAGYTGGGFKLTDKVGGNVFGLDANANVAFDDEFEGKTSRDIGDLRSLALAKGVSRNVMREILEQYGGNNIKQSYIELIKKVSK